MAVEVAVKVTVAVTAEVAVAVTVEGLLQRENKDPESRDRTEAMY